MKRAIKQLAFDVGLLLLFLSPSYLGSLSRLW